MKTEQHIHPAWCAQTCRQVNPDMSISFDMQQQDHLCQCLEEAINGILNSEHFQKTGGPLKLKINRFRLPDAKGFDTDLWNTNIPFSIRVESPAYAVEEKE